MRPRPCLVIAVLSIACAAPLHRAAAQLTILDRARRAAQDAANAGSKAVTQEVNQQINSAVENAAQENVADGSFTAVLSPWVSSDGTKQVQLARYSGLAFVANTPSGRQIIICDTHGILPWQTTFAISNAPPAGGRGAGAGAGAAGGRGGAGSAGRGGAAPATAATGGRGGGIASGGGAAGNTAAAGGRGGADSAGGGASGPSPTAAPSAGERDYRFPTAQVTVTLPQSGAHAGTPSQGSFHMADVSETAVAGGATIRFSQATIPGTKGPQVVDFGLAFKARALPAGQALTGCLAPGSPGRGGVAAATPGGPAASTGRAAPSATALPDRGAAATPAVPPANGPVFAAGDVLTPKIDNVKLMLEAKDSSTVSATLKKGDDLVYLGDDQNGYAHVQGSAAEGWVKKVLLVKH
ncbi:MAG TPA: hypothetical protein VGL65_07235 [Gemmatimonadales bacterium]